mmetsp:Transcript_8694/g.19057  ORF Transcript_8694/g.19057 Transcript_8694/m.19057 type:complete len:309 (-) Transcript_8694:877-1803(-)
MRGRGFDALGADCHQVNRSHHSDIPCCLHSAHLPPHMQRACKSRTRQCGEEPHGSSVIMHQLRSNALCCPLRSHQAHGDAVQYHCGTHLRGLGVRTGARHHLRSSAEVRGGSCGHYSGRLRRAGDLRLLLRASFGSKFCVVLESIVGCVHVCDVRCSGSRSTGHHCHAGTCRCVPAGWSYPCGRRHGLHYHPCCGVLRCAPRHVHAQTLNSLRPSPGRPADNIWHRGYEACGHRHELCTNGVRALHGRSDCFGLDWNRLARLHQGLDVRLHWCPAPSADPCDPVAHPLRSGPQGIRAIRRDRLRDQGP